MTYCSTCGCHVEPAGDARVGWKHACRHTHHRHAIPFVISAAQKDRFFPKDEEAASA